MERHDVVIIGGGPSGLACAGKLQRLGVRDAVVLERDPQAGGVPRHCGHFGFGWESHRRLMTGPAYAARLHHEAAAVDVRTGATVLEARTPTVLRVQTASGVADMEAGHIVLATGAREATRAQRLMGGTRVPGVMTTGTLQQMVYLQSMVPFRRPVIVGGEWVSFSALMTCHHAGIRPVAMLAGDQLQAPSWFRLGARLRYGVPVKMRCNHIEVEGTDAVTSVTFQQDGATRTLACDGVVLTGQFRAESALLASGVLPADARHVTVIGNAQVGRRWASVMTAGRCVADARQAAVKIRGVLA